MLWFAFHHNWYKLRCLIIFSTFLQSLYMDIRHKLITIKCSMKLSNKLPYTHFNVILLLLPPTWHTNDTQCKHHSTVIYLVLYLITTFLLSYPDNHQRNIKLYRPKDNLLLKLFIQHNIKMPIDPGCRRRRLCSYFIFN